MKSLLHFNATKVLASIAFCCVYYLGVPDEHQIFKFIALLLIVGILIIAFVQDAEIERDLDVTIKVDPGTNTDKTLDEVAKCIRKL